MSAWYQGGAPAKPSNDPETETQHADNQREAGHQIPQGLVHVILPSIYCNNYSSDTLLNKWPLKRTSLPTLLVFRMEKSKLNSSSQEIKLQPPLAVVILFLFLANKNKATISQHSPLPLSLIIFSFLWSICLFLFLFAAQRYVISSVLSFLFSCAVLCRDSMEEIMSYCM